jgi:hypothetical protein
MSLFAHWPKSVLHELILRFYEKQFRRFQSQLGRARVIQRELLFSKVRHCAGSRFGRDHFFREIKTVADFRRNIPIARYEYYYPYIKQVTEGNVAAMFPADEKLVMFTLSSGTTGDSKLIPVTRRWLQEFQQGWQIWGIQAFLKHRALVGSKMLAIVGNWDMRRTPTGIPCGMASGLSARFQNPLVKRYYVIPAGVFAIDDAAAKYYTLLRLALAEPVRFFSTATPATVIRFAKLGNEYRELLIRDIAQGTLSNEFEVPPHVRTQLSARIRRPQPERARQLENIVNRTGTLYPKHYWDLAILGCWLGGTVGSQAGHMAEFYGDVTCRDIGLLSSEGRHTIPMEDGTPVGALAINSHYYEFVPEDEINSPQPTVLECHELEVGKKYFILMTTSSGLYRYNIYDVVRCTGYVGETPLLEFLHKGERCSDMEGEKITEYHLVHAVAEAAAAAGIKINQFTAVPVRPENELPHYTFMVEEQEIGGRDKALAFLAGIESWLVRHNVMYQTKRDDRYLGAPRLVKVPAGTWGAYAQAEVARRRVGDDHYKHPYLVLDEAFLARFPTLETVLLPADGTRAKTPARQFRASA